MVIKANEDRNIVNFARKIVGEKLITERRLWETMRDNKNQNDVKELGEELIRAYKSLMIGVTSLDLLNTSVANISINVINLEESQKVLIDKLSTYLLLELKDTDLEALLNQLSHSILYWQTNKGKDFFSTEESTAPSAESILGDISNVLSYNIPYIVLILLSDLHHLTYVASADQCLEILSST